MTGVPQAIDGEQDRAGASEEVQLLLEGELAQDDVVRAQRRQDVVVPVPFLLGLGHLDGEDQARTRGVRGVHGPHDALVGVSAAQEQQEVLLLLSERIGIDVDAVVDHAAVSKPGHVRAMGLADRHVPDAIGDGPVQLAHLRRERSMDRMHRRTPAGRAGRERRKRGVNMEYVECFEIAERVQGVGRVIQDIVDEPGAGGSFEDVVEPPLGGGVARGEQRDVVSSLDQAVGQQGDHPFDAAVALRGDREPRRSDLRDPHDRDASKRPRHRPSPAPRRLFQRLAGRSRSRDVAQFGSAQRSGR